MASCLIATGVQGSHENRQNDRINTPGQVCWPHALALVTSAKKETISFFLFSLFFTIHDSCFCLSFFFLSCCCSRGDAVLHGLVPLCALLLESTDLRVEASDLLAIVAADPLHTVLVLHSEAPRLLLRTLDQHKTQVMAKKGPRANDGSLADACPFFSL